MERGPAAWQFSEAGFNYRLTDFQAALGRAQLPQLLGWIAVRRALASVLPQALAPLERAGRLVLPADHPGHSWQTFMVVLADGIDRAAVIARSPTGHRTNLGAQCVSAQPIVRGLAAGRKLAKATAPVPRTRAAVLRAVRRCRSRRSVAGALGSVLEASMLDDFLARIEPRIEALMQEVLGARIDNERNRGLRREIALRFLSQLLADDERARLRPAGELPGAREHQAADARQARSAASTSGSAKTPTSMPPAA